ncbi:MAG: DUF4149 domain-containing protein [Thermoleophilia bacterium]|nr:DUF4149 domain-containing protein [Thermoleophilia bacterium]
MTIWTLVLFIHLLAIAAWLGGMLFLGAVVVPSVRAHGGLRASRPLVTAVARRFGVIGGLAWVVILVTGLLMVQHRGGFDAISGTDYGRKIMEKLGLLVLAGVAVLVHSLWQGPRLRRAEEAGDEAAVARWRRMRGVLDTIVLLATLAALYLGASLSM